MKRLLIITVIVCILCASCHRGGIENAQPIHNAKTNDNIDVIAKCSDYDGIKERQANYVFGTEVFNPYVLNDNRDEIIIPSFFGHVLLSGERYTYYLFLESPHEKSGFASYRNYFYKQYMYEFIGDILDQKDYEEKTRLKQLKEQNKGLNDADDEAPKVCIESDGRCYDPKDLCMGLHEDESGYTVSYKISSRLKLYGDEYGAWDDSGVYVIDDDSRGIAGESESSGIQALAVAKHDHSGNQIWKSNPISGDPEIPTSILGVDRNHVYVLTCRGEILAFDVESGKAVWKNSANIKMDIELSESGRRYKFKSSEETGTFALHYPTETSQALEVYDASDGRLVFGVHAEVLHYEIDAEYLYYAHGDEIRRIAIGSAGSFDRYVLPDKSGLCHGMGALRKTEITHLSVTETGVYAEYLATCENGWIKTLVGWRKNESNAARQTLVATNFGGAGSETAACKRYWATNHAILDNAMLFLDIAQDKIVAVDLETGALAWHMIIPEFRPEEQFFAINGFEYRDKSGATKESDIYRYAGAVRFYSYEDKLVVVYRGIRVLQLLPTADASDSE